MSIRKRAVGIVAGAALVVGMGIGGAGSATAAPPAPAKGRPCVNVNFERHTFFYRYYFKNLDTYNYCYYRVADYAFIGAHGKIRDLPMYVVYKR